MEHDKEMDRRLHERTRAWTRQFLRRQMAQWCCERARQGREQVSSRCPSAVLAAAAAMESESAPCVL